MNQHIFNELSKDEVRFLNNGGKEAEEAWRAGYLYIERELSKLSDNKKFLTSFLERLEEIKKESENLKVLEEEL